jgi:hypothetical protein
MNEPQPWEFTCKTCGGHNLTVTHVWSILAGPDSESWQEVSLPKMTPILNRRSMRYSNRRMTRRVMSFM